MPTAIATSSNRSAASRTCRQVRGHDPTTRASRAPSVEPIAGRARRNPFAAGRFDAPVTSTVHAPLAAAQMGPHRSRAHGALQRAGAATRTTPARIRPPSCARGTVWSASRPRSHNMPKRFKRSAPPQSSSARRLQPAPISSARKRPTISSACRTGLPPAAVRRRSCEAIERRPRQADPMSTCSSRDRGRAGRRRLDRTGPPRR